MPVPVVDGDSSVDTSELRAGDHQAGAGEFEAGLIPHPKQKWIDIKEARDKFVQVGDTTGGRFDEPEEDIQKQLEHNREVLSKLQGVGKKAFRPIYME